MHTRIGSTHCLVPEWNPLSSIAHGRIIIPRTEADQAGLRIVQPTSETEGLEAGVGVLCHQAPGVVVQPLGDLAAYEVRSCYDI